VQYLYPIYNSHNKQIKDVKIDANKFMHERINNHLDISQWFYHFNINVTTKLHTGYDYLFRRSCANGLLNVALRLFDLGIKMDKHIDIHAQNEYVLRACVEKGHNDIINWLFTVDPSIKISASVLLYDYCNLNMLEKAKQIYACIQCIDSSNTILTTANIRAALKQCCKSVFQSLPVCKWLYDLDTSRDQEFFTHINLLFATCCLYNHHTLAVWLYDTGYVDITADNHWAFRYCCDHGYTSFALWFVKINKNYKIISYTFSDWFWGNVKPMNYKIKEMDWFDSPKSFLFIF